MSKKVITETSTVEYNAETGELKQQTKTQVAVLGSEDKYYKFYKEGLDYIIDMPVKCTKVFYALLDIMTYVDQPVIGLGEHGMHIFLNADIKRGIAKDLGYANYRQIDNVIQQLLKGDVLIREGTGIFRPNPSIVARGAWKEICHLREEVNCPLPKGETFKSVCEKKDAVKKQLAEQAAVQAEHQTEQLTIDGV